MPNALSIAAVTATLKHLLDDAVAAAHLEGLGHVNVGCNPPDALLEGEAANHLNLYLWKVTQNPAFANEMLPSHTASGARLSSPRLGLDLHLMMTATGTSDLHAPILLGIGMQCLHEHPVLSQADVATALHLAASATEADLLSGAEKILRSADLADQIEKVRITPARTEDDVLTQLWPAFNAALRMSVLYKVSVVLIETPREIVKGPPVRRFAVTTFPLRGPVIDGVQAQPGGADTAPDPHRFAVAGGRVLLTGRGLVADHMALTLGGIGVTPGPADLIEDRRISVMLPATLPAGLHLARIEHYWTAATDMRLREASRGGAFIVAPTIASLVQVATGSGPAVNLDITVTCANPVKADQSARLFLTPDDPAQPRRAMTAKPMAGSASPVLRFVAGDVAVGDYSYALSIDGGESAPAPLTVAAP